MYGGVLERRTPLDPLRNASARLGSRPSSTHGLSREKVAPSSPTTMTLGFKDSTLDITQVPEPLLDYLAVLFLVNIFLSAVDSPLRLAVTRRLG